MKTDFGEVAAGDFDPAQDVGAAPTNPVYEAAPSPVYESGEEVNLRGMLKKSQSKFKLEFEEVD